MPFNLRKRVDKAVHRATGRISRAGEAIDAVVMAFSPRWGLRRQTMRRLNALGARQEAQMAAHFEGADNTNRLRGDTWLRSRLSPDSALEQDLDDLRGNSDELYRNFSFVRGAIEKKVDNVIGTGMRPQARLKPIAGQFDEAGARELDDAIEDVANRWAQRAGRGGRETLWQIQQQIERNFLRDGEAFVVLSDVPRSGKPVPLELEVVAAERVETPPGKAGDPFVRLGIEYARNADGTRGDVIRYHVRITNPDDTADNTPRYQSIPANRMLHRFDKLWPNQSRGIPWASAITADAKDYKDYREATIISAQVAACVTMIISTSNPHSLADASQNSDGEQDMEPGKILYKDNADQVHTLTPSQPTTSFSGFSEQNLMSMASGLNWPFGWFTGDRRRASYSAGRLEEIDGGVPIRRDQQNMRDQVLVPVWEALVGEMVVLGLVDIDPTDFDRQKHRYLAHMWVGPGRPWIDPPKEVDAAVKAKEHNLTTITDVLASQGKDVEETVRVRGRETRLEREHDVVPPITSGEPLQQIIEEGTDA